MSIRRALPTDSPGAKAVVQKSVALFGLIANFDNLDAAIGALGRANSPNEIVLVAEVDGKLISCLAIQPMEGLSPSYSVSTSMRAYKDRESAERC